MNQRNALHLLTLAHELGINNAKMRQFVARDPDRWMVIFHPMREELGDGVFHSLDGAVAYLATWGQLQPALDQDDNPSTHPGHHAATATLTA